jgi:hypothetical protein
VEYQGWTLNFPVKTLDWNDIYHALWVINDIPYHGTFSDALRRARNVLLPAQAGPSIIGHGDAHNGNVFFAPSGLIYFDPAFGGRHHPLLDVIKPLFHNVFATWMYHPQEIAAALHITANYNGLTLYVDHDYQLSDCRRMFFTSKIERVVKPLIRELRKRGQLSPDWRTILKSALLCCPLLTMNLADAARFPPPVALLGLCFVAEMGLNSKGSRSVLDRELKAIAEESS